VAKRRMGLAEHDAIAEARTHAMAHAGSVVDQLEKRAEQRVGLWVLDRFRSTVLTCAYATVHAVSLVNQLEKRAVQRVGSFEGLAHCHLLEPCPR
jgi:hypothetical protein